MSMSLKGKRVLYVAPRFFGYEQDIAGELRRRGAEVDFLRDRPFDTPLMTAVTRVARSAMIGAADRYYRKELEGFGRRDYDFVFVVNGQTLSAEILASWKREFPTAKFILYMWDSFGNRRWAIDNLKYFDHCFSFDCENSKEYGLHFRPLFFGSGFERPGDGHSEYGISFVGTMHTDRYAIVRALRESLARDIRTFWYLYLQAPWVYWWYRASNPAFRTAPIDDFRFRALSKDEVRSVFFDSNAILDIEHPRQTGLTIRTFETLGAKKKLITTNRRIADYDFFDAQNILFIDRRSAAVPREFLETPYAPVPEEIYDRYRLSGWMAEILRLSGC